MQIKTESGSKMKTHKTGIYKKWKDQSHKRVSVNGTNDGGFAAASTSLAGNYFGKLSSKRILTVVMFSGEFYIFLGTLPSQLHS